MTDDVAPKSHLYVAMAILIFVTAPLHAWTLANMWNWFVVPPFGAPTLGLWQVMGLQLLYSASAGLRTAQDPETLKRFLEAPITEAFARTMFYLGLLGAATLVHAMKGS